MSILKQLRATNTTPPSFAELLKQFPRKSVASQLGITPIHATNILSGYRIPGKTLNKKILELVVEVEQALQVEQGGRADA